MYRQSVRRFPPCAPLTTTNRAAETTGSSFTESLRTTSEAGSLVRQSSRRARPSSGAQAARDDAGFVRSRGASSPRTDSASRLMRSQKPLFSGLSLISTCSRNNQIPTPHAMSFNRVLCSRGFRIDRHHHLANPDRRRDANRRGKNSQDLRCRIRGALVTRT